MILDLFLLRVFHAPSYCSFMFNFMAICGHFKFMCPSAVLIILVMLILLFLIGVVKLAPHMKLHQGASINYQLNIYYVLIDYRLLNRQWYLEYIHYDYDKFNY